MSEENLLISTHEGVREITLNRPEKKNALDGQLFSALAKALQQARKDNDVHVVMLSGAGGNFCSGMDLGGNFDEGSAPFDNCAAAMAEFDKPLIAAVEGIAIGGGATIPLHCDVVYVGESLRMRFPFVNLGLVPEFSSSYLLQANIGAQQAAEIMFTAEWINSERAVSLGLASRAYPNSELHSRARAKAEEMAQWPVNALVATKRCLKATQQQPIAIALAIETQLMAEQVGSPENTEAITAFFEKRPPNFRASKA